MTHHEVTLVGPNAGEHLDVFGSLMRVTSDGARTGLFIAENTIPPGYLVPPHIHDDADEVFYLLEGELTLTSDQGESRAGPGTSVLLPRGKMHGFRNDSGGTVRFLTVCEAAQSTAEMFRHYDRAGRSAPGGLSPTEIVAIAARYGVRMT